MKEKDYYLELEEKCENLEVNKKVREYKDNSETLRTYWEIGELLVEAQGGIEVGRAKYGDSLIKKWSAKLTEKFGKTYNFTNLTRFRLFYLYFPIIDALRQQLTWTHIRSILPIKNENARNYYINQVILNNLSTRQLDDLIKSKSFDRLSYADKENIKLIETDNYTLTIEDMIKDPIIIKTDKKINNLSEKALHKLIVEMLKDKFLELGVGFALIGEEYKFTVDNKVFAIDLLFFNYELNSFVVVETKTREFMPKDIGQLNFYVNYIDKNLKKNFHNKTIGILIVKKKNKFVIEYTTSKDIYITNYKILE